MSKLPKHLQETVAKYETKLKQFGIKPMSQILKDQEENMKDNPFHVLHAYTGKKLNNKG